jgi:hypothetical protein
VTRRGREPFGRELVLARGQSLTVTAPLAKTGRRRAVPWLVGAAGALAAGAAVTAIIAVQRDNTASDLRSQIAAGDRPPSDADAYDAAVRSRDRFADSAWGLGAAALAVGALGAALYVFDEPGTEHLRVAPIATATTAGVVLGGRF